MTLSAWDDFPVHQAAEFVRHPATSDRNFYDRYYFNMHPCSEEWFAIFGFGQYPNLGVVDAFVDVRIGDGQHIVRASKPLGDRSDLSVGPFRIEVLEPLRRSALRGGTDGAPRRHGHHLGRPHPGGGRAAPVRPGQGEGDLRHPAARPDGYVDGGDGGGRRADRDHPGPVLGQPATAPGASGRWERPSREGSARATWCSRACGRTSPCSSRTTPSCTSATNATTGSGLWCRPSGSGRDPARGVEELGRSEHEHHLEPGNPCRSELGDPPSRGGDRDRLPGAA